MSVNGSTTGGVSLEARQVSKVFGAKVALDAVDLSVPAGAFCVLLGPSGSGKTTLLRCVAGIERLTAGRLFVGGRLVADGPAHTPPERRDMAMVFQDYALWPHLSASRNVEFALRRRRPGRGESAPAALRMLERVGLAHLADRYPNELSGGEQQRVALARALVASTGVLLFDEPLSNLDADLRERLRIEIGTLARDSGATSLYITHDQSEAFALADMIGVMQDGHLVQVGTPEEIYHRPASPFVARFTGLAGELEVVVADRPAAGAGGAPTVNVRLAAAGAPGAEIVATVPGRVCPAGPASLLVRPAGVRLLPAGHADGQLDALVVDSAYRGRGYDHALMLGDGTRLVGVHDERRWPRGASVAVRLHPAASLVFPQPARPGHPSPAVLTAVGSGAAQDSR